MNAARQIDLTGGESIYCINTYQIDRAREMYATDDQTGERVRSALAHLEEALTRNERAAVAMLLLEKLNGGPIG